MKKLNNTDYKVLELISKKQKQTRMDLSEYLDISPAAISKIIKKLMEFNLIYEDYSISSKGGRPRKSLKLNGNSKKIIGVNFGSGFMDVSISGIDGVILDTVRRYILFKSPDSLVARLKKELDDILDKYGKEEIVGIGLAINGIVNNIGGSVVFSPHLKWSNFKLKEYFENMYNIPVIIENDVRSMLMAEIYENNNSKNVFFIYLRYGIGAALLINNKIFSGDTFSAGEIGHYIVNPKSNSKCKCGKFGCLEAEFSTLAIREKISWESQMSGKMSNIENLTDEEIYIEAQKGVEPYHSKVKDASFQIGNVVGNVLNILNIENIVITGDILDSKELFKVNFSKGLESMLTKNFDYKINIKESKFGKDVEKYGALYLVISNLFSGKKIFK